ncbi:MAG: acyl-CoA dehydrogenase family protein [Azonexus sp.]|jgi:acyl-CoA dehydrogenase|nr:acyl-CoA dehydrogenase family protein [Azonexus sp.]
MSVINVPRPASMQDPDLQIFEDSARRFFADHATPEAVTRWRANGQVDIELWGKAAKAGLLMVSAPEEYGGGGGDFRHDVILQELASRMGVEGFGFTLQNVIVGGYILSHGTEEQKRRWLPRLAEGKLICAIAMTEPNTGSDLQAIRTSARKEGGHYRINGTKTFISNGLQANLICVVASTDPGAGSRGLSLLMVETENTPGFERGQPLKKIGTHAQDTAELFFSDAIVPIDNLLGGVEGKAFPQLMKELARERLMVAVTGVGSIELALEDTIAYVKERSVFGQKIFDFQNTQFKLAECKTEATIAKVFVYHCLERALAGELDTATASMAKLWVSEAQGRIVDQCLQFFGGYGYMEEYRIARLYTDARVQRIYGGANEIMKMLIARTL